LSKETPAFVCSHIFEKKRPVLLVCRADGDWQFLCGGDHADEETPRMVGLNHLLDADLSLNSILDLPADWEAKRTLQGSDWKRRPVA
jgi:hypothetical protein